MRRLFFALLLAMFATTPVSAANFYWKASTTDLNAIAAPSAGDRGIVITDAGAVSYWTYSGSAWVQAFADLPALGPIFAAATSKTTPVDADEIPLSNSQSSGALNALSWADIKATLKTYFDTIYTAAFTLTGNGGKMVVVNSGGTALETTATLTNIKIPVAYDSVPIGNATSDDMVDTAMAEETVLGRRTGGHLGAIAIGSSAGQIATGDHTHSGTYESALGNPDADGKVLASTADGVRSWVTAGVGSGMTVITATGNFTVPASTLIVELVGAGGGGGRSDSVTAPGCGGGGGGYAKKIITGLTVGNVIAATIGAGGVKAAASNTAGSAGGATSFGTHLSATGGAGGAAGIDTAVDAGVGSNGNLNLRGGMGESNPSMDSSLYTIYGTGRGGDSKFGVGGIRKPKSSIAKAPTGYGAGGYGGLSNVEASDGTPGVIIVHY